MALQKILEMRVRYSEPESKVSIVARVGASVYVHTHVYEMCKVSDM